MDAQQFQQHQQALLGMEAQRIARDDDHTLVIRVQKQMVG
jgi:hypothetical protein